MDNPEKVKSESVSRRKFFSLKRGLRRDEGWNYMEATLSVVMLTVVFLGLTITLIAFREWMTRAWAIRVMDQYANDVASHFHEAFENAHNIGPNPPQYGLGAFWMSVVNFDFSDPYSPFVDSTIYQYSARPTSGIYRAISNTASQKLDPGFPPQGWNNKHRFIFTDFGWEGPYQELGRSYAFSYPMARVHFSIHYQRPRQVEEPNNVVNRNYDLEKKYVISGFMRNYGLTVE